MEDDEGSGDKEELDAQNQNKGMTTVESQHLIVAEQIGAEELEMVVEDMELDGIEKAYNNPKTEYIPFNQIALLKKAIIKSKGV